VEVRLLCCSAGIDSRLIIVALCQRTFLLDSLNHKTKIHKLDAGKFARKVQYKKYS
jgi:hypothetical protein